jgi:aryl-alcohol dehydrogenase-like predicted oxidoreductase
MTANRMGYGAMQLSGVGPPRDVDVAATVLHEPVKSGVNQIETSDYYARIL